MRDRVIVLADNDPESCGHTAAMISGRFRVCMARGTVDVLASVADTDPAAAVIDLASNTAAIGTIYDIRRVRPDLPVVAISANALEQAEAIQAGATDCVRRPFDREQLIRAVDQAIEKQADSPALEHANWRQPVFVGGSRMRPIWEILKRVAASDVPVLFRGETGSGKEVLAREVHGVSRRAGRPFMKVNCAAVPSELLESELFGYERGAFTGAMKSTQGKLELANGGTILLDEIGDMELKLQAKLLHFLQDREFQRLGGHHTVHMDVRIMSATHCDLERALRQGRFREDLYYRLNVITVQVPPLRDRRDEILPLADYLMRKHAPEYGSAGRLTPAVQKAMLEYDWPGNVRELENLIHRILVLDDADEIAMELVSGQVVATEAEEPPAVTTDNHRDTDSASGGNGSASSFALDSISCARRQDEANAIAAALERAHWNRRKAADLLNIEYRALLYRMSKLGIGEPRRPAGRVSVPAGERAKAARVQ